MLVLTEFTFDLGGDGHQLNECRDLMAITCNGEDGRGGRGAGSCAGAGGGRRMGGPERTAHTKAWRQEAL